MLNEKIKDIIDNLSNSLVEREESLKLLLLAALSGEHILLLGPPGTAKSELARRIKHAFVDANYFERLLTKFSVPEELFGPLSIKALENDQYSRLIKNYLPDASIAFIDEIFKSNSAILNTLLTLLNEREFDNGDQRLKTPLISVVAASNELPEENELSALYDRFLLRYQVAPVSQNGFEELLTIEEDNSFSIRNAFSHEDIESIKKQSAKVKLPSNIAFMLKELREYLQDKEIYISDRRWRKVVKLLKVAALTNDRDSITVWDCWLLQHCLWEVPEQQSLIFNWYKQHIGTSEILNIERVNKLVKVWQQTLSEEKSRTVPVFNDKGEKLFLTPQGNKTTESGKSYLADRDGEALYLIPTDTETPGDRTNGGNGLTRTELENDFFDDYYQQRHINGKWVSIDDYLKDEENRFTKQFQYETCQEAAKYSQQHIDDRCNELQNLLKDIQAFETQLSELHESLSNVAATHLWIDNDFTTTAAKILEANLASSTAVTKQINEIHEGFKSLPLIAA